MKALYKIANPDSIVINFSFLEKLPNLRALIDDLKSCCEPNGIAKSERVKQLLNLLDDAINNCERELCSVRDENNAIIENSNQPEEVNFNFKVIKINHNQFAVINKKFAVVKIFDTEQDANDWLKDGVKYI